MFNSSALFATIAQAALFATLASAAKSVNNYTGTIADFANQNEFSGVTTTYLKDLTVEIELDQKCTHQVTYEYTVKGWFDPRNFSQSAFIGLCYPTAADAYDCVEMEYAYTNGYPSSRTFILRSATGVTKTNAEDEDYSVNVVTSADDAKHCGGDTIKAKWNNVDAFEHEAPETASTLCDELSMDAAKQAIGDKTFTIQGKVTPAQSAGEAEAAALLTTFKTASVSMFSALAYTLKGASQKKVNEALALSFTEIADAGDAADACGSPDAANAPDAGNAPDDDGASAMTIAVAITAAVAALF